MYNLYFEDLEGSLGRYDLDLESDIVDITLDLEALWCGGLDIEDFIRDFNHTLTHELMHLFILKEGLHIPYCTPKLREEQEYDFIHVWRLNAEEQIVEEVTR